MNSEMMDRKDVMQWLIKKGEEIRPHWDKNGVIQYVDDYVVILKRQIGLQLQFVAAFSHFTSLGYELKAIDEGMQANPNGVVTGGLGSYYYFQKISTQKP